MPAGKRGPLSTRGTSEAGGGVLLKSFTPVSDFTEETPQSAYGCQFPFQGSLLRKLFVCSSAAMSKPSGGIARCPRCPPVACQRRLLPLPVSVMLIFRCFPVQTVNLIFYGVLQAGGGVHPRSITSRAAVSKPSGGIRSLPSLSACGLPTPIVVLACICDADIRVFSGAGVSILPPLKGEGDQRSWWRGSAEIFYSCFRFHGRNPSVSLWLPVPLSGEPVA